MFEAIARSRATAFGLIGALGLGVAALAVPVPLRAQSNDPMLEGRLSNIERQVNQLQGQISQSGAAAPAYSQGAGISDGEVYQRLGTIEESLRTLTGQVEELAHRQAELQARLDQMGGGAGMMAPGAVPGTSGSAAPGMDTPGMGTPGDQTLGTLSTPSGAAPIAGNEDTQFAAAVDVLYRGDYAGGTQALQSFVEQHPKSPKTGEAYYWLGESQLAQKAYREAAEAFLQVVQNHPKDAKAPQSLVKLGVTLIAAGEKKEGCNQLKSIKEVFPKANQSIVDMAARERTKAGC